MQTGWRGQLIICMYVCIFLILFMYGLLLAPLLLYNSNTTSVLLT